MTEIFILTAWGGQYEDYWTRNICACQSHEAAMALVESLDTWLTTIRNTPNPPELNEDDFDFDDDQASTRWLMLEEQHRAYTLQQLNVPHQFHAFLHDNWKTSYSCDRPNFSLERLEVV